MKKNIINVYVGPTVEFIESNQDKLVKASDVPKKLNSIPNGCIVPYPEEKLMPKDAASYTKSIIDTLFDEHGCAEVNFLTVSTDVCLLANDYGRFKKFSVKFFLRDRPSTLSKVFKKFNESFSYLGQVTGVKETMAKLIFFHAVKVSRSETPFKGKNVLQAEGYGKCVKPYTIDTATLPANLFCIGNSQMEPMSNEWIADELNMSSIRQPQVTRLIHQCTTGSAILDWVTEEDDGSCEDGFPPRKFVDAYFVSQDECDNAVSILNQKFANMAKRVAKEEGKTLEQVAKDLGAEFEA